MFSSTLSGDVAGVRKENDGHSSSSSSSTKFLRRSKSEVVGVGVDSDIEDALLPLSLSVTCLREVLVMNLNPSSVLSSLFVIQLYVALLLLLLLLLQ